RIKADGTVPTSAALQAFALAIAPLPGVKVPSGPAGTIRAGGSIVRWMRGHWNDLTAAPRAAVQKAPPGTAVTSPGGPGLSPPTASTNSWPNYIDSASSPLLRRWHDALGCFGQAAQTGLDLWPLFPKFFQASGNVNRYHVIADAAGDKFLDNWGSGYWMNAAL